MRLSYFTNPKCLEYIYLNDYFNPELCNRTKSPSLRYALMQINYSIKATQTDNSYDFYYVLRNKYLQSKCIISVNWLFKNYFSVLANYDVK